MIRPRLAAHALALLASVGALAARADSGWGQLNMTPGVTEMSRHIYALHMEIFWICVWIGVAVFGVMIWSMIRFRKSQGAVPDVTMVHNTKVEMVWTVVPVIILVAMAVPAAKTLVEIEDTSHTELTIKVTGFQWGWNYDYLDNNISYFSHLDRASDRARELSSGIDPNSVEHYLLNVDHPLVVPVGTKVRLINEPVKVAWVDGELYIEAHPPVNDEGQTVEPDLKLLSKMLQHALGNSHAAINWDAARAALIAAKGMPTLVGIAAGPQSAPTATAAAAVGTPAHHSR